MKKIIQDKIDLTTTSKWIDEKISLLIKNKGEEIKIKLTENDYIELVYEKSIDKSYKVWILANWLSRELEDAIIKHNSLLTWVHDFDWMSKNIDSVLKKLDKIDNDKLPLTSLLVYDLDLKTPDARKLLKRLVQFIKTFNKLKKWKK